MAPSGVIGRKVLLAVFLFSGQPATGHLNPMISIAQALHDRGHESVFAVPDVGGRRQFIESQGFQFCGLRPPLATAALELLNWTEGFFETFVAVRLFFHGLTTYARQVAKIIDEVKADAAVAEFFFFGSCVAAESKGIPNVIVYHAGLPYPGDGIPPFASGLPIGGPWDGKEKRYEFWIRNLERYVDKSIARCRQRMGLGPGPGGYLLNPSSPWLTLVLTSEAMEAPRKVTSNKTFFVGPCFSGRGTSQPSDFPFETLATDKPKVYLSLGTVFNKKPEVFSKIIAAFADGAYQLIVSAGGAFPKLKTQKPRGDLLLFPRVPQVELLTKVDAVISHGGNNTTNETLAAGKPLLIMPVGGEQRDNASRVVYLGAGLRADLKSSTPEEIRKKVHRLLDEPSFAARARQIADALGQTNGPDVAARLIERVVQTGRPLVRLPGDPLTVTAKGPMPCEATKEKKAIWSNSALEESHSQKLCARGMDP